jgi:hypothetical protein
MQALWEHKTLYQRKDDFTAEEFYDRAGIWAEFGKIVCISVGYFTIKGDIRNFRVTSFFYEEKNFLTLIIYSTITSINRNMFCADTTPKSLIFFSRPANDYQ